MKIELELKIDDEIDNDKSNLSTLSTMKDQDKHQVLFSPECSSLYSSTRPEASYDYDYEINQIRFGEEKEVEYMYIKTISKILGDKYIKIDPETSLYDTLNFPYSGDEKLLNNMGDTKLAKANIFKRLVSKKKKKITNSTL